MLNKIGGCSSKNLLLEKCNVSINDSHWVTVCTNMTMSKLKYMWFEALTLYNVRRCQLASTASLNTSHLNVLIDELKNYCLCYVGTENSSIIISFKKSIATFEKNSFYTNYIKSLCKCWWIIFKVCKYIVYATVLCYLGIIFRYFGVSICNNTMLLY